MPDLRAHGIGVGLPAGWDGRISVRRDGAPELALSATGTRVGMLQARPVMHLANFGLPNDRGDFDPYNCRRGIPGQSAYQEFFQDSGRAFCLYVVLGSHAHRHKLVPMVNRVLSGVRLDAAPAR